MTIIRNDRRQREATETAAPQEEVAEEEVDYSWHPSDEELPDPIPADRWLAMLSDPAVFDKDGLHAVECVDDYGGPVTFQQLSVKYRGTMGRYRKWLNGVAERAAIHEGREPAGTDQFGQDEWWPYLYRRRIAGKTSANVFEMLLRPEIVEALRKRDEADSAERKRHVQEAADAERARRAEQRRARLEAAERAEAERRAGQARSAAEPADDARTAAPVASDEKPRAASRQEPAIPVATPLDDAPEPADDLLVAYLQAMEAVKGEREEGAATSTPAPLSAGGQAGAWRPLDYATRYADRLAEALELIAQGLPGLTVAQVARELGDESVERLQACLNGGSIPSFAYLKRLCDLLFLNEGRLEAPDSLASGLPVFSTLRERLGIEEAARLFWGTSPKEVVFVVDGSPERRAGIVVRLSALLWGLLDRVPVSADADRYHDPALGAYVRLVRELDARADGQALITRSLKVSAADWDALASGRIWPGTLCR